MQLHLTHAQEGKIPDGERGKLREGERKTSNFSGGKEHAPHTVRGDISVERLPSSAWGERVKVA